MNFVQQLDFNCVLIFSLFQILALGATSATVHALCLCRQHATSLAAVQTQDSVSQFLSHCGTASLVKVASEKKDYLTKQTDIFQPLRDIVNKRDLNFIAGLGSGVSKSDYHSSSLGLQGGGFLHRQSVKRIGETRTSFRSNVQWTQSLQREEPFRDEDLESQKTNSAFKAETQPVKYSGNNGPNKEERSGKPDSSMPSLEKLEIVKEYYINQVIIFHLLH